MARHETRSAARSAGRASAGGARSDVAPAIAEGPRALVVDDDEAVAKAMARALRGTASRVSIAADATQALALLASEEFDVVLSDVHMPRTSGTELLKRVRERDLDLPVILLTGHPTTDSAAAAVEHRAFRYLTKPVSASTLREVVLEAARLRALTRLRTPANADRETLHAALLRALSSLSMAYQPIVSTATRNPIGYEALMRSAEPALRSPLDVLDAAEKLGALHAVGRQVRALVARDLALAPPGATIFVNLHPADLADSELYDPLAPLSPHAPRVVLEITERASLETVADLELRLAALRGLGFRLAIDDLGAGYAGLSYFARVRPQIVKIDLSLVRDVHADPVRQRVVLSLVSLASGLGMEVVAEGVETVEERDALIALGCTHLQGYVLARPAPPFAEITWR